jgi:L-ascorbate metabolism protein UlaG (beta-lactamase superfamily)
LIQPKLRNESFLADVEAAGRRPDRLHVWWLGQSGFLVKSGEAHLLLDPYLSDSLTRKYEGTNKPHERLTGRVIAPERLDFVDIVTSSHNHTDHLDAETILPLLAVRPNLRILVPEANLQFAAGRLGIPAERLSTIDPGKPVSVPPFTFHAVPAAHEAVQTDSEGRYKHIGLVVQAGGWTIYHSGDTVRYPGMVESLRPWSIDLALLPINGRDPARGVPGNLTGREAVQLARDIEADLIVPCHFGMFAFNSVSPQEFAEAAKAAGQSYRLLENGERLSLPGKA